MNRVIVVMGVSGSGKSTLAEALARKLELAFLEGDDFHPEQNRRKMAAGIALEDEDRWPWLDALSEAITAARITQGVIATCSALKRSYRDRIRAKVTPPLSFVFLSVAHDELVHRLQSRRGHFMPAALLESQLNTLEIPAVDEADAVSIAAGELGDTLRNVVQAVGGSDRSGRKTPP
jgi:gluconokinase